MYSVCLCENSVKSSKISPKVCISSAVDEGMVVTKLPVISLDLQ